MKHKRRFLHRVSIGIGFVGLGLMLSPALAAQTYFFNRADFATRQSPQGVAVGDFNRDGRPDVAVADKTDNKVSVLLGQSNGSLGLAQDSPTGTSPVAVVAADFNGDRILDLAVANSSATANSVSVLLGNGNGTFQSAQDFSAGATPSGIAAADFDGSGKLDLAVTNSTANTVSILLNNGNGTFSAPTAFTTGPAPSSVAAGDFDGNGKQDLAVANKNTAVLSLLLGNGNGTFQAKTDFAVSGNGFSVAAGDLDNNGKLDVAVASNAGVSVLFGNGDGSFQPHTDFTGMTPTCIILADLDGNLDLDMVTANNGGAFPSTVSVFFGTGGGAFQSPVHIGLQDASLGVAAADFNGDGRLDLVASNFGAGGSFIGDFVSLLINDGNARFYPKIDLAVGGSAKSVAVGDFNNDGKLDLVSANSPDNTGGANNVSAFLGNGDGTFQARQDSDTGAMSPVSVAVGLCDGNITFDIAVANSATNAKSVSLLLGNGDGTFTRQLPDLALLAVPNHVLMADFNNDGKTDLAVTMRTINTVSVYLGDGTCTFSQHTDLVTGTGPVFSAAGDLNHDNKVDLAVADLSVAKISVLMGNGNGTFQPKTDISVNTGGVLGVRMFDVNIDSNLDLVACSSGVLSVLLGNGDGTFQPKIDSPVGPGAADVAALDINHDGFLDLAVVNGGHSTFSLLLGHADGTFNTDVPYLVGFAPFSIVAADFNGDGDTDLATANSAPVSNSLSVVLASPLPAVSPSSLKFPVQLVGRSGAPQNVTLTNGGSAILNISGISTAGDFRQTNDCASALIGGADCSISVTFKPAGKNVRTGTLTIAEAGSSQTVSLSGTGTFVNLQPRNLNFGNVQVGQSATVPVTLQNTANVALNIASITITGDPTDFSQTNNCGTQIGAHASCTISVTFTPLSTGAKSASLSISDNGGGSPQKVALKGTGI